MCGILGIFIPPGFPERNKIKQVLHHLFILSESRGKEASGLALCNGEEARFLRSPFPASDLVASEIFSREVEALVSDYDKPIVIIGHSRLVTNGYEHQDNNNQPVVKNGMLTVHNGIITNVASLWEKYPNENRQTELDSELIPTLFSGCVMRGLSVQDSLRSVYKDIYGMTTFAMLLSGSSNLLISTNNGSLYYIYDKQYNTLLFASERYFLNIVTKKIKTCWLKKQNIQRLIPYHYLLFDFETCHLACENLENTQNHHYLTQKRPLAILQINQKITQKPVLINRSMEHEKAKVSQTVSKEVEKRQIRISGLKRCSRCILPESFPYITFDSNGVCNYCHHYQRNQALGLEQFQGHISRVLETLNNKDCLVPFSGGRDSSFALHFIKKELGMNPVAFSYDWGMLTDLARRNQSRMCGALGVEHILVSADIRKKREYIRKNVTAWLKRPELGTIPLFMAGDKKYFYFINLIMKQNKLLLSIFGENLLETTRFKSGFCGIRPRHDIKKTYTLTFTDKLKMAGYYAKEYLLNPAYINASLFDTLDAFRSYYLIKHTNINIFDYIPWDEDKITSILINDYQWETDPETTTTWRIGDGTAAFYNFIYYMVAGFTENDTFRSNQIREGMLDREKALALTYADNQPRFDSINWYCKTIGADFNDTIETICKIKPLFSQYLFDGILQKNT